MRLMVRTPPRPQARRSEAARGGAESATGARARRQFPGAQPSRARPGPRLPARDLKGPSPFLPRDGARREVGFVETPS